MKLLVVVCLINLAFTNLANAQKASLHIRLVDSSARSPSDYIFELEVRNDSFPKYWVEDTARIRSDVLGHPLGLFNVIVSKYEDGSSTTYGKIKVYQGDPIPEVDSCVERCCNCEILEKGQAFKMKLPLVTNYIFEKGHYIVEVTLHPPGEVCDLCEQLGEIYTDIDLWVR